MTEDLQVLQRSRTSGDEGMDQVTRRKPSMSTQAVLLCLSLPGRASPSHPGQEGGISAASKGRDQCHISQGASIIVGPQQSDSKDTP